MSDFVQIVDAVLKVSVIAFMAGNLLAIGLETDLRAALAPCWTFCSARLSPG